MRKIALFVLIALAFSTSAWALPAPDSSTVNFVEQKNLTITKPISYVKIVRFGDQANSLASASSGDVVYWSADGVTVTRVPSTLISGDNRFAGVLVTDILTGDMVGLPSTTTAGARNWGYMCYKGYCIASIDYPVTAGNSLIPGNFVGAFSQKNAYSSPPPSATTTANSADAAIALTGCSAGGKAAVMIK